MARWLPAPASVILRSNSPGLNSGEARARASTVCSSSGRSLFQGALGPEDLSPRPSALP
jgi:hypothetical protein